MRVHQFNCESEHKPECKDSRPEGEFDSRASSGMIVLWSPMVWALLLLAGLVSILIKPYLSFASRVYFSYENAWDEATYLSYQGALAIEGSGLRWLSALIVRLGHEIGLSGSIQNLILDITTLLVVCSAIHVATLSFPGMRFSNGLRMAWFGGFGTILFNQANPLLLNAFPSMRAQETIWAVALESYLPILRSPEPQVSLLLVAAALIAFFRYGRHWWVLLLPAPFLYFPVAIFYGYVVGVYLAWLALPRIGWWGTQSLPRLVAANVAAFLTLATGIFILGLTGVLDSGVQLNLSRFTHAPRISPLLFWTVASLSAAWFVVAPRLSTEGRSLWQAGVVTAIGVQVFIVNQQVISGTEIHPGGLQAVAGTGTAAFALCVLVEAIARRSRSIPYRLAATLCGAIVSAWILVSLHAAQGLDLVNRRYLVFINHDITHEEFTLLRERPLKTLAPPYLASYIVLATPSQIALPFAYQYGYPWYTEACAEAAAALSEAGRFVAENRADPLLVDWLPDFDRAIASGSKAVVQAPRSGHLCGKAGPEGTPFRVIPGRPGIHFDVFRWQ